LPWQSCCRSASFAPEATREDNRLDIAVTLMFPLISFGVLTIATALCTRWMPGMQGALADWPWWQMVPVLLVADDLTQYFWHRLSHTSALWPLHRAHHSAAYMSVRIVYRNNAFYYALMPGLWLSGVLVYLGFGCYVGYTLREAVGDHLRGALGPVAVRHRVLHPLAWLVEHTISTPATHFAALGRRHRSLHRQLRQSAVRVTAHLAPVSPGMSR
jgi:hypothetical protein